MFRTSRKLALPLLLALGATAFAQTPAPAPQTPSQPSAASTPQKDGSGIVMENQDSFIVVGLTVRTNNAKEASGQGAISPMWQGAIQNGTLEQIPNKVGDGYVVVYSDYASDHTGDYSYTLGYRVSSAEKIPDGMVARTVRSGKYAAIASETGPPQEVIPALWHRINTLSPEQLGGDRAYATDFETYGPITDWGNMSMTAHIGLK